MMSGRRSRQAKVIFLMKYKDDRRSFLQKLLPGSLLATTAGLWLTGCAKKGTGRIKKSEIVKAIPCEDLTGVPAVEAEKRKALGYTRLSPMPDRHCNNCQLFVPPKEGTECGGCLLFAGPVSPEGYCTYWAPVV